VIKLFARWQIHIADNKTKENDNGRKSCIGQNSYREF
jgi:hypothetical protein